MKSIKTVAGIAFGLAALVFSLGSLAHHSAAGYDTEKRIEVTGIVTRATFRNPHGHINLKHATAEGYEVGEWEVETAAANLLRRRDWDFRAVKKDMKVTLVGHPAKDGKPMLYLREIHLEDGTFFGDPEGQDKALD